MHQNSQTKTQKMALKFSVDAPLDLAGGLRAFDASRADLCQPPQDEKSDLH